MATDVTDSLVKTNSNSKYSKGSFQIVEPYARISFMDDEYSKALEHDRASRERGEKNWRMYSGFNYGQWPAASVSDLTNEGRHIAQYNFIRGKVDALAGSIAKNWFDIDFVPVDGQYSDLTMILKELYLSDKEMLDWDENYFQAIVDGLIHRGVEQMIINTRYNELGNIGFERVLPGRIILDPMWKTNSGWDLKRLWKVAYLTPTEIMDTYDSRSDRIRKCVEHLATHGHTYEDDTTSSSIPNFNLNNIYGTQYRVIEYHHIEREKRTFEFAVGVDNHDDVRIPDGTAEQKREWLNRNKIDTSNGIIKKKTHIDAYYVSTSCSDLDHEELLEDRLSEIQIGRLPFVMWSAARIGGIDSGVVELMEDIQLSINKRESLWEHILSSSAMGATIIDPELVDNDRPRLDFIIKNLNKPNMVVESAPGRLASGRNFFAKVPREQYHGEIDAELQRMTGYLDRISKQTATLDGRNESSHDTGILFARRQMQSEIAQTVLMKGAEKYCNEKAELYLLFAPQHYGDTYREFTTGAHLETANRSKIVLNETVETPEGKRTINNIKLLPRHKVITAQSPQGITLRAVERAVSAELLRSIGLDGSSPITRAHLTKNIMKTLDGYEQNREELIAAAELERALAEENVKTQLMNLKSQQSQIMGQLQAAQAGAAGGPGGGNTEEPGANGATQSPDDEAQGETEQAQLQVAQ